MKMDKKSFRYVLAVLATLAFVFFVAREVSLSAGLTIVLMLIFAVGELFPIISRLGYLEQKNAIAWWNIFLIIGLGILVILICVSAYNQYLFIGVRAINPVGFMSILMLLAVTFYSKLNIVIDFTTTE